MFHSVFKHHGRMKQRVCCLHYMLGKSECIDAPGDVEPPELGFAQKLNKQSMLSLSPPSPHPHPSLPSGVLQRRHPVWHGGTAAPGPGPPTRGVLGE
jgi:hypothetical protein